MYFPPTLVLLFLSTTTTTTASLLTQSNGDDPAPLLAELQPSGNDQHITGNPNACTSSSEESFQFSIGRRGVGMCPPSPETIPGKQPAPVTDPSPPTFNDQPLQFTSPENLSPLRTAPVPEDDKCPTNLMKMSRIPVCDSGKRGRDVMRLPGEQTYTLFNIRFYSDSDPCVWPCKPWCCAATGSQIHPLFPLDPPVLTGYVCRNIEYELIYQEINPLAAPQPDDPGKWPELPPSQRE